MNSISGFVIYNDRAVRFTGWKVVWLILALVTLVTWTTLELCTIGNEQMADMMPACPPCIEGEAMFTNDEHHAEMQRFKMDREAWTEGTLTWNGSTTEILETIELTRTIMPPGFYRLSLKKNKQMAAILPRLEHVHQKAAAWLMPKGWAGTAGTIYTDRLGLQRLVDRIDGKTWIVWVH